MINVSSAMKAAFRADSMFKYYTLVFPEYTNEGKTYPEKIINNASLLSDSVTLTEPMCSEEQLKFGCCEAATFEFEMQYESENLAGRIFNVYLTFEGLDEVFTVGRYIVDTEEMSNDRKSKAITAYDIMYVLNMLDVFYWYHTLSYPLTIKQVRDSLFEYIGQEQVSINLPNDNIVLSKDPLEQETDITFEMILKPLCEVNGVFGHINRDGYFEYKKLVAESTDETYPNSDLYPSSTLYPMSLKSKNYYIEPELIKSDITWQNYKCKTVDTVQARDSSGNVLYEYHLPEKTTYTNVYVLQGNWIIDALDSSQIQALIYNFANAIKDITYTPCDANVKMNLSLEVGDAIMLMATDGTKIPTYIFNRTMTGITHSFDEIEATGYEEWINEPPNTESGMQDIMDDLIDLNDRLTDVEGKQASGEGSITIESVQQLPASPRKNVLYLVQGKVYVQ